MLDVMDLSIKRDSFANIPVQKISSRNSSGSDFFSMVNSAIENEFYSTNQPEIKTDNGQENFASRTEPVENQLSDRPGETAVRSDDDYREVRDSNDEDMRNDEIVAAENNAHAIRHEAASKKTESSDSKKDTNTVSDEKIIKSLKNIFGKDGAEKLIGLLENRGNSGKGELKAKIDEFIKQWQSPSKNEKSRFMLTAEEGKNLKNILDKLIETGFGQKLSEKQVNRRGAEKSVPGEKITMPEIISKLESMAAKRGTARNEKQQAGEQNSRLLVQTEKPVQTEVHGEKNVLNTSGGQNENMGNSSGDNRGGSDFAALRQNAVFKSSVQHMHNAKPSDFRENLEAIINRAKITVRDSKNGNFSVKLYPKELGNLNVQLSMENGVIHGKFHVESDEAKNALLQNMENFKEQMKESGINIGEFSVSVNQDRKKFLADQENREGKGAGYSVMKESEAPADKFESNSVVYSDSRINLVI